jgi:OOP family OmpA-OmpF porin
MGEPLLAFATVGQSKRTIVTTRLLTFLALAAAESAARAQVPFPPPPAPTLIGPYVGASFGYSDAKKGCLGILSGGGRSCDQKDPSFGIFGGYQVNRFLSAELGYRDLGKVRASGGTSSSDHIHAALFDFTGMGIWPIEERFSAYGRLGGYRATLDTSARGVPDQTNTQLTYGGGLQWDFIGGYGLRADWQRYRKVGKESSLYGVNYYDVFAVALVWRFR